MSWWDYGYQITAMANRTVLVDNNTWNNTHISRVGYYFLVFKFITFIKKRNNLLFILAKRCHQMKVMHMK